MPYHKSELGVEPTHGKGRIIKYLTVAKGLVLRVIRQYEAKLLSSSPASAS